MKWDKYKFKLDKYMYENWTFMIVTLIMAGVIVFEGYLISDKVNNQKIVFMPPKMVTKEFWIAGNVVSKTYLEQMGFFISSTLLNIDSQTSKYTIQNILPLVEPNFYYKVKSMLQEQINYIKDNDISRVFYPSVVKVKKGELNVIGVVKDIIGDKVVSNQQVDVKINYKIKQGRFWVAGILVEKAER